MAEWDLQHQGRGNRADYAFGNLEHGWTGFDVIRFHAVEELSCPFQYVISLVRQARLGPIDLDAIVDRPASFRIASEGRWRTIHGIVAETEELDRTSELLLYRVLLVPPFWRARYRRRCRNFVDQSLESILTAVLENRSPKQPEGLRGLELLQGEPTAQETNPTFASFTEPSGAYRWAVTERARLTDTVFRKYVVQYNESDFDFLSRLLEEEGLTYMFEHTSNSVVMTITDWPGRVALFPRDEVFQMAGPHEGGARRDQEAIDTFREARRLRSRAVTMRDFSWPRSRTLLEANVEANGAENAADLLGHFEFPARDEAVAKDPCLIPSRIRLERFEVERSSAEGAGTVRRMEPGVRFTLSDREGLRTDADYLITRVETYATQLQSPSATLAREPFGFGRNGQPSQILENEFTVLPFALPFRPPLITPKPRIDGVQTALVTAEEMPPGKRPEINSNTQGQVRVRFPWDQRPDDGVTPSSMWIRVSQAWAGGGYGAVHTPRVGHEVLIAYFQGDPERPVIVGRVYNVQTRPPYDLAEKATISTIKSDSSPDSDGFNEFRYEDKRGSEQIFLHAQKDFDEVVRNNHSTNVGHDQRNNVEHDQFNFVTHNRQQKVLGTEDISTELNRTTTFQSNESHKVRLFRGTDIGKNDDLHVHEWRNTVVDLGETRRVNGPDVVLITDDRRVDVWKNHFVTTGEVYESVAPVHRFSHGNFEVNVLGTHFNCAAGGFHVNASRASNLHIQPAMIVLGNAEGASIALVGGMLEIHAPEGIRINGSRLDVKTSGPIVMRAEVIKLNPDDPQPLSPTPK